MWRAEGVEMMISSKEGHISVSQLQSVVTDLLRLLDTAYSPGIQVKRQTNKQKKEKTLHKTEKIKTEKQANTHSIYTWPIKDFYFPHCWSEKRFDTHQSEMSIRGWCSQWVGKMTTSHPVNGGSLLHKDECKRLGCPLVVGHQGGRGWRAFGERKIIPQSFRRERICKFSIATILSFATK